MHDSPVPVSAWAAAADLLAAHAGAGAYSCVFVAQGGCLDGLRLDRD